MPRTYHPPRAMSVSPGESGTNIMRPPPLSPLQTEVPETRSFLLRIILLEMSIYHSRGSLLADPRHRLVGARQTCSSRYLWTKVKTQLYVNGINTPWRDVYGDLKFFFSICDSIFKNNLLRKCCLNDQNHLKKSPVFGSCLSPD